MILSLILIIRPMIFMKKIKKIKNEFRLNKIITL